MIQRIQTVYLLVVAILMVVMMSVIPASGRGGELHAVGFVCDSGSSGCNGLGDYFPLPETHVTDSSDHLQYDCTDWLLSGTGLFCHKSGQGIR